MKAMMDYQQSDQLVIEQLGKLQFVESRDSDSAVVGRDRFLFQAQQLGTALPVKRTRHLERWPNSLLARARLMPLPAFVAILLAILLLVGGGTVAVDAAQESLPNQLMYGLKLAIEDVRLGFATESQTKLELSLQFADLRTDELIDMVSQGYTAPETVAKRYEEHIAEALHLIALAPDDEVKGDLSEVRVRLRTQEQKFRRAKDILPVDPVLNQVHNRIQLHIKQVEDGMLDPDNFRKQFQQGVGREGPGRHEDQSPSGFEGNGDPISSPTPDSVVETSSPEDGESEPRRTSTPSHPRLMDPYPDEGLSEPGESQTPRVTGTTSPGSGYGPGSMDGDCVNCAPNGGTPSPKDDSGKDMNDDRKNDGGQPGDNPPEGGGNGEGEGSGGGDTGGGGGGKP